ncbi:hypothetical protein [Flagellimonas eckloniae]|uniref:Uncharacterized protein n=1 Tax=Flagellimonas eckloniae TaxID=346185 RepID=A0A0N8WGD7_9FLAO|nr:hypothetical protein [Allomuricauda eckloniae]KQC31211.1 hypothetical protein AAY42_15940 [Allomuricauda eckloniae]
MKKLNIQQKVILGAGLLAVLIGIFGKISGWEYDYYFVPFYTGISLSWIAFLDTSSKCCNPFKKVKRKA